MALTVSDGFPYYISLLDGKDYQSIFRSEENYKELSSLTEQQSQHRYAEGKWSIKQIVGHIADHERIMMYRILRFSRGDGAAQPGYDQDVLVNGSRFDALPWDLLLRDFKNVRTASISLMDTFSIEQLQRKGQAWKFELTVEEYLKSTIGHELHHMEIIRTRYSK